MNRSLLYLATGAVLLLVAGLANAVDYSAAGSASSSSSSTGSSLSVDVSISTGYPPVYSHSCAYSYYYGYYYCQPYSASFGAYCDPFDPFYSRYCYSPYSTYYPTYVVNPGTIVYTSSGAAAPQPQGPPCSDATPSGMCSTNYPKYCFDGQLIDKATLCGCPEGQVQDPNNRNRCVAQTCEDGTALNSCSPSRPKFCTANGVLVDRPTQCGCPAGTKLEGGVCAPLNSICFVSSAAPSTVRVGERSVVSVSYSDVQNAGGYVNCGNGQVASLACSGGTSGTCVASCAYSAAGNVNVQAYVNGQLCSSSTNVNVAPQLPTGGDVLVRVTDCATGKALPGARLSINGQALFADANGEGRGTALLPGVNSVSASYTGYTDGLASTVVTAGRTSVLPVCLNSLNLPACDVELELAGQVTTNNVQSGVQLRVSNNLQEANTVSFSYSSPTGFNGPLSLPLAPGASSIVTVTPVSTRDASLSGIASVTATGKQACSSTVNIPLNLNGGVSMRVLTPSQTSYAGGKACFDFSLQNRGEPTQVWLSASSTGLAFSFDSDNFVLANGESKNVRLCATIPEGATGNRQITVQGISSANNVAADVSLAINPAMYSNVLGCFNINSSATQFMEVKLTNTGASGSFEAQLSPTRGFSPSLTQGSVFNFASGSTRSLFVQVDPSSMSETDSRATLSVFTKGDNVKVFEQELCFQKPASFDSMVFLSPARISVEPGKTGRAFVHIQNAGNTVDTFEVVAVPPFQSVNVVSTRVSINPREEKTIEIAVSPASNIPPATYLAPLDVYSLADPAARRKVASLNLVVDVKQPLVAIQLRVVLTQPPVATFNQSTSMITLRVPVTNFDDDARTITPSLAGLPANWTYTVSPAQVTIPKLGSTEFQFTIAAKELEPRDYNATVLLTDEVGRQATHEVVLPAKSASWVTGFFVLGSTSQLLLVLVFVLVVIGLYLIFKAWATKREIQRVELAALERS